MNPGHSGVQVNLGAGQVGQTNCEKSAVMGESKVPIHAYVDETGNTGHNLFDEKQPDFWTAALVTKGDFDLNYGQRLLKTGNLVGTQVLHAKELGVKKIEVLSIDLLELLRAAQAHFFVSRVEKRYLLASKMFDSIFDSGENAAVGWHNYNIRPLRLMLAFKFASILSIETASLFWKCIMEPNKDKAMQMLPEICAMVLENVNRIPDERSRQIIGDGLQWARSHPESMQIHTDRAVVRKGHFPNLVAFTNLIRGLENYSTRWKRGIARINHDQQSEMKATLELYHSLAANASGEIIKWAGESYKFQMAAGSEFRMVSDEKSAGIQVTDVVLWLYARFRKGDQLPEGCSMLLDYVFRHGWESDFSFGGVEEAVKPTLKAIMDAPFPPAKERESKEMLEHFEKQRLSSIAQYEKDKISPFARQSRPRIDVDGNATGCDGN